MAGKLVLSTLNDDTGSLAIQNGMTGIPKCWLRYNASTQTIIGSYNVSSVTRQSTGRFTVNFTTAMPNSNYATNCNAAYFSVPEIRIAGPEAQSTTNVQVASGYGTFVPQDVDYLSVAVFSS